MFNYEKYLDLISLRDIHVNHRPGDYLSVETGMKYKCFDKAELSKPMQLLADMDADWLSAESDRCNAAEKAAVADVVEAIEQWGRKLKASLMLRGALEIKNTKMLEHSNNTWVSETQSNGYVHGISNSVYKMELKYIQEEKYNYSGNMVLPQFIVSWHVAFNTPTGRGTAVFAGSAKKFSDSGKAEKYMEGIKAKYADLFTEECPSVPAKDAYLFSVNGVLLPGYRLEEDAESLPEAC